MTIFFWVAKDSNDDSQLYQYDGELVNQLTNNNSTDNNSTDPVPYIYFISEVKINKSNGNIVWVNGKQFISVVLDNPTFYSDVAIYLYNGERRIQITDDNFSAYSYNNLQFMGSNLVWIASLNGWNRSDDIFLYNSEEVIQITENDFNESISELHILGDNLFWVSNTIVYLYKDNEVITLMDNDFDFIDASIVGDNFVFTGYNGDRSETYLYKNNEITPLVSHDSSMVFTYTDNSNSIVWYDADTIKFYNGFEVIEITDNYFNDIQYLEILDNSVVWAGKKDADYEVYLYDGTGIIQLTNDNIDNFPRLVGDKYIVWNGNDGNDDEIYLYDINKNKNEDITYIEIDLLNHPIYRFQNTDVLGTYIFVGEEERQNIITNYPNFIEEGEAFKVAITPDDDLIVMNRFQNKDIPGTYLYAGEEESISIRANYPNFVEEGIAFYVYDSNAGKGIDFYRFQNSQIPGTYIFVGEEERQAMLLNPNFIEEGVAFEVLV
ncbi:alkaline phosphatase [Geminocystis sp. NIES-3708]|uniref:hypothetical protein n=1 Tax=Geminocystis sp. NIES-3708 TaxID=1615909 RepID=UPI0005FC95F1|nr:hypothetical protein [Geminocystis sp. NIES-3708]BAQ63007.1 alkaline phosphatase [Geminocystis sp. NIES-3708]